MDAHMPQRDASACKRESRDELTGTLIREVRTHDAVTAHVLSLQYVLKPDCDFNITTRPLEISCCHDESLPPITSPARLCHQHTTVPSFLECRS